MTRHLVPIPATVNTGTGFPWVDVQIGDRTVSIFHDRPGHWYALGDDREVHHGRSFREVKERLTKIAIETGAIRLTVRA